MAVSGDRQMQSASRTEIDCRSTNEGSCIAEMPTLYRQNLESVGYQEIKRLYNPRAVFFFQLTCANFERDRRGDFSQRPIANQEYLLGCASL